MPTARLYRLEAGGHLELVEVGDIAR
jgi:hypothetical protein